jgi:hypothetical protein
LLALSRPILILIYLVINIVDAIRERSLHLLEGLFALMLAGGVQNLLHAFHFVVHGGVAHGAGVAEFQPVHEVHRKLLTDSITLVLDVSLEYLNLNVSDGIAEVALDCSVDELRSKVTLQV